MNTRAQPTASSYDLSRTVTALFQLTKPGITRMVLVTGALGSVMAPGRLALVPAVLTLLGTVLVVASANVLNMYLEQDTDALMRRTMARPLPTGRVSPEVAFLFGIALGGAGVTILMLAVNALTGFLALFALVTYVLVYTPMKSISTAALYVGAIPGAMPPVLGYTGISGSLDAPVCALFLLMFAWQIPHFLAISVFRTDEYRAASLKIMPTSFGLRVTRYAIFVSSLVLALATLLPWAAGLGGPIYLVVALSSGAAFLLMATYGQRGRTLNGWARALFFASIPHLVLLLGVLGATAP